MTKTFIPSFNDLDELRAHQLRGLQWTVEHAYEGSEFYRRRLAESGVAPQDIQHLDDIRKLPFTTADDLRDGYPFPFCRYPNQRWFGFMPLRARPASARS